jgi:hypothetical protein
MTLNYYAQHKQFAPTEHGLTLTKMLLNYNTKQKVCS